MRNKRFNLMVCYYNKALCYRQIYLSSSQTEDKGYMVQQSLALMEEALKMSHEINDKEM
jgi:hypothetical protein